MNRKDLQRLARLRLKEAKALLAAGLPAGAYYLAGYTAECALKAVIAKRMKRHEFPDLKLASKAHVHRPSELLALTDLWTVLQDDMMADPSLAGAWGSLNQWKVESRYDATIDLRKAEGLIRAAERLLKWLKRAW